MADAGAFLRSQKGMILMIEIVFCIVILICLRVSAVGYISMSGVNMVLAIIFLIIYVLEVNKKLTFLVFIDFFRALIGAILYLITSVIILTEGHGNSIIVGGVLGLVATLIFGYDASITNPWKK